jgi:hypothetical protein
MILFFFFFFSLPPVLAFDGTRCKSVAGGAIVPDPEGAVSSPEVDFFFLLGGDRFPRFFGESPRAKKINLRERAREEKEKEEEEGGGGRMRRRKDEKEEG